VKWKHSFSEVVLKKFTFTLEMRSVQCGHAFHASMQRAYISDPDILTENGLGSTLSSAPKVKCFCEMAAHTVGFPLFIDRGNAFSEHFD
jgi:hypothetical protein